jgi:hypothetical protein
VGIQNPESRNTSRKSTIPAWIASEQTRNRRVFAVVRDAKTRPRNLTLKSRVILF